MEANSELCVRSCNRPSILGRRGTPRCQHALQGDLTLIMIMKQYVCDWMGLVIQAWYICHGLFGVSMRSQSVCDCSWLLVGPCYIGAPLTQVARYCNMTQQSGLDHQKRQTNPSYFTLFMEYFTSHFCSNINPLDKYETSCWIKCHVRR